jgi:hypothetical protein
VNYIPTPTLTWTPGDYVQDTNEHQVYFGTSFNDVNNATPDNPLNVYKGIRDVNNYTPDGYLAGSAYYYWRIDEVNTANGDSPWRGRIWRFQAMQTPCGCSIYPPEDSNIGFDVNKLYMRWTNGLFAAYSRVYFGTDYNSVRDANTSTPVIYRGVRTDANYPLSALSPNYTLVPNTTYFWRVDEVNDNNPDSPWIGYVWRFVFPNNYIVENFDEYASSTDLSNIWKINLLTGSCPGGGYQGPGGTITLAAGAMTLDYNNTGLLYDCFSDARYTPFGTTNKGLDWTVSSVPSGPVKLLHVSYMGLANNDANSTYDRMYVMIADTNAKPRFGPTIYNPDPNAQRKTSWTDWYIKLSDLNSPNPYPVDLKHIRYLFLGFGLRCNIYGSGHPGGHGQVTFDNIWVTQSICLPEYQPVADFTGDCVVDMDDVRVMSEDWLTGGSVADIYPADNPDGIVDFRDFAVLAQEWLTEHLWP